MDNTEIFNDVDRHLEMLRKNSRRLKRSTYTRKVAIEFKPYFDKLIENIRHSSGLLIPYEKYPSNKPDTLYKKVCDALLWLRDYLEKEEAKKYWLLKELIDIRKHRKGIELRVMSHLLVDEVTEQQLTGSTADVDKDTIDTTPNWIKTLKFLIRNPNREEPLQVIRDIELSQEDKAEAKRLLVESGVPTDEMWIETTQMRWFAPGEE